MATSGPGATNLVTPIADAKLDSIPLIALTGQVGTPVIGTDAFQETPIVEVCRGITKHHYLITDVADVARVMREAFYIATTGRPRPALRELVRRPKIPVTMTLIGLGAYPGDDPLSLEMLGMHGSVYANYAVDHADLLLAFGVRVDDRVTGKVSEFAKHGKRS